MKNDRFASSSNQLMSIPFSQNFPLTQFHIAKMNHPLQVQKLRNELEEFFGEHPFYFQNFLIIPKVFYLQKHFLGGHLVEWNYIISAELKCC